MSWQRFEYICRRAYTHIKKGETVTESLSKAKNEEGLDLYGDNISPNSMQYKILGYLDDLDRDKALGSLVFYKDLQMNKQLDKTLRFKRVFAYLCYVSLFFFTVVSIYHLKVTPTFESFFTDLGWGVPPSLALYGDYGGILLAGLLLFLLLSLTISFKLTHLMEFREGLDEGLIFRFCLFPSIKKHYYNVKEILGFPIELKEENKRESKIFKHLKNIDETDMDLAYEMKVLLEIEMSALQSECHRQVKLMTTILFSVMVFSLFSFLVAAYTPIFYMGEGI